MRVPPIVVFALVAVFASVALAPSVQASRESVVYLMASGFSPGSASIAIGDRVRFTVRDHKAHQVAKTSGPNSGEVPPTVLEGQGHSVTLAPTDAGPYTYVDRLNPRKTEFRLMVRTAGH
jgi:plastocyanin